MVSENGGNWISVDENRHPISTPMESRWVIVYAPDDDWGPGGNVHLGLCYAFAGGAVDWHPATRRRVR